MRSRRIALGAALALTCVAAPASAAEGPPAGPGTTQVLFVGNNWDGTADLVDQRTYKVLKRINVIPDIDERMAEIRSDPERLGYYLAIQQLVGEGHDQYADDAFTSHDGRFAYVSRPSLADVIGLDLATGTIVWRFPMEGQRSDHMAISPDGIRLMVSDSTANKVHVLDPRSGEKVAEYLSGNSPHENNYSADGTTAWHASIGLVYTPADRPLLDSTKGERYLQVVDTRTYEFERYDLGENLARGEGQQEGEPYPDSPAIRPMAISPDERIAYLQLSFFHGYVVYDLEKHVIRDAVSLPNLVPEVPREQYLLDSAHHGLAINPDGEKLCAAGTMSNYAAIVPIDDPGSHVLVEGIDKPYWSTNSGDGRYCFVSASGSDEVVVVEYATGREVTRIPVGDHPQRMRLGVVRNEILGLPGRTAQAPPPRSAPPAPAAPVLPTTGLLPMLPTAATLLGLAALATRRRRAS